MATQSQLPIEATILSALIHTPVALDLASKVPALVRLDHPTPEERYPLVLRSLREEATIMPSLGASPATLSRSSGDHGSNARCQSLLGHTQRHGGRIWPRDDPVVNAQWT
jgi:hypothetical protein